MTWWAQRGEVVLSGEERQIFRDAIFELLDKIVDSQTDDESVVYGGASLFNAMTQTQQAASVEAVSSALFHKSPEYFPLTAWSEATLASILAQIRCQLAFEIDIAERSDLRQFLSSKVEDQVKPSDEDWSSHDEWGFVFECYEDQFLWDNDFESTSTLDLAPEAAAHIHGMMGISDDYHSSIPPDLAHDWELNECYHRVLLSIDGQKRIKMQATITIDVPASMEIQEDEEWGDTLAGFFPAAHLMFARGIEASEPDGDLIARQFGILEVDHLIEEIQDNASIETQPSCRFEFEDLGRLFENANAILDSKFYFFLGLPEHQVHVFIRNRIVVWSNK